LWASTGITAEYSSCASRDMSGFTGDDGDQATGNVSDDPTHTARQPVSKPQLEQSAVGVTETSGMAPKSFYSHSRHGRLLKKPVKDLLY